MLNIEIAEPGIIAVRSVTARILIDHRRRRGPAAAKVDLERGAATGGIGVVVVLLYERRIVDRNTVLYAIALGVEGYAATKCSRSGHVVDETRIALVETDHAQGRGVRQWHVDHAFDLAAYAAVLDGVDLGVDPTFELGGVRLVGDDADRARFRTRAVQRALRPREAFNPRDVINVNIEVAADGGDRLFVQIDTNRGQRARVVAVAAARHAAHVDDVGAGCAAQRLERHRWQLLRVIVEAGDVELIEFLGAERLDADRHILQAFAALLCGNDDLAVGSCGRVRGGLRYV